MLAILQTAAHQATTRDKLQLIVECSLMRLAMMRYIWRMEPVAQHAWVLAGDDRRWYGNYPPQVVTAP